MDWKEYEQRICEEFKVRYPDCDPLWNVHLPGTLSGTQRQIDILIKSTLYGQPFTTVIDAKMYNKPIDVKSVEEFLGLLKDVGANRGLMVTTQGYSKAAIERSHRDDADIELDVMSIAEFKEFQGPHGIPYSGDKAVMMPAPFGWVFDISDAHPFSAALYQRGRTFNQAARAYEFAYFNFWHKEVPGTPTTIDGLIKIQNADLWDENPDIKISEVDFEYSGTFPAKIRLAKRPHHPAWEYTGLIEFPDFIFFIVMFTLPQLANRNLRKLIEMMHWAKPISINFKDTKPK